MAPADDQNAITISNDQPYALQVFLHKERYVIPWCQFLYAEETEDGIRMIFSTHDILVNGSNLDSLLKGIAFHQIERIRELPRSDGFSVSNKPFISKITIERIEPDRA
jgi:hypothetical protein